jgi:hypothetical protein
MQEPLLASNMRSNADALSPFHLPEDLAERPLSIGRANLAIVVPLLSALDPQFVQEWLKVFRLGAGLEKAENVVAVPGGHLDPWEDDKPVLRRRLKVGKKLHAIVLRDCDYFELRPKGSLDPFLSGSLDFLPTMSTRTRFELPLKRRVHLEVTAPEARG